MLFFFNDTATTEIYTLSLHDALPICRAERSSPGAGLLAVRPPHLRHAAHRARPRRDRPLRAREIGRAHVELQSRPHLVCRLLLEKKKKKASVTAVGFRAAAFRRCRIP